MDPEPDTGIRISMVKRAETKDLELGNTVRRLFPNGVRCVSMNEQADVEREQPGQQYAAGVETFHNKFHKKYNQFKKTQSGLMVQYFGKSKVAPQPIKKVGQALVQSKFKQHEGNILGTTGGFGTDRGGNAFIEKKMKEAIRIKRKILDGEIIDSSKFYIQKDLKKPTDKETHTEREGNISERVYTNESTTKPLTAGLGDSTWYRTYDLALYEQKKEARTLSSRGLNEIDPKSALQKLSKTEKDLASLKPNSKPFSLYNGSHLSSKFDNTLYQEKVSFVMVSPRTASPRPLTERLKTSQTSFGELKALDAPTLAAREILKESRKEATTQDSTLQLRRMIAKTDTVSKRMTPDPAKKAHRRWMSHGDNNRSIKAKKNLFDNKTDVQKQATLKLSRNASKRDSIKSPKLSFIKPDGVDEIQNGGDPMDFKIEGWENEFEHRGVSINPL